MPAAPQNCTRCNKSGLKLSRHHLPPYEAEVYIWVCSTCHGRLHRGNRLEIAAFKTWLLDEDVLSQRLFVLYMKARVALVELNSAGHTDWNPEERQVLERQVLQGFVDVYRLFRMKLYWQNNPPDGWTGYHEAQINSNQEES
jgi:hypothetical protein